MPLPSLTGNPIKYGKVTWTGLVSAMDSLDEDDNPDIDAITGTIIFKPSAPYLKSPSSTPKFTVALVNRQVNIADAQIDEQGRKYIKLEASVGDVQPDSFTWTAVFNLAYKGVFVTIPNATFQLLEGQEIDLTDHIPPADSAAPTSPMVNDVFIARSQAVAARDEAIEARDEAVEAVSGIPTEVLTIPVADATYAPTYGAILAASYGVSPSATRAENVARLQAAVNAAIAAGKNLILPTTGPGETIKVDATVTIGGAGGIEIQTPGRCVFDQSVREAVFKVSAPNVIIRPGFEFIGQGLDMTGSGGPLEYVRFAAVWIDGGSHGARVYNMKATGFHRALRIDASLTETPEVVPNLRDIIVDGVLAVDCWTGVSVAGVTDLALSNIRGNYKKAFATDDTDTAQPPHLIYIIDRESVGRLNYNVSIRQCHAWDGADGAAYALKGIRGYSYDGLFARNCEGILDLINLTDGKAGSAVSIDDVYPAAGARASVAIKNSVRAEVRAVVTAKTGDYGRLLYVEGGTEDSFIDVDLTVNKTTAVTGNNNGVGRVSGKRNEVRARVTNLGASMQAALSVSSSGSERNTIRDPVTAGSFRYPIELLQGYNHVVEYDARRLVPDAVAGAGATSVFVDAGAVRPLLRNRAVGDVLGTGWFDNFNRTDGASLASTTDGQAYTILNGAKFTTVGNASFCNLANTGGAFALPAGGTPNGTWRVKIGTPGVGTDGFIFRTDYTPAGGSAYPVDGIRLGYNTSGSDARPRLQTRLGGGSWTTVATAPNGTAAVAGSEFVITASGTAITVTLDGTSILTYTDNDHGSRVASGLFVNTPAANQWKIDEIQFTPAA
ncbi:hypothetical protein SEA_HARAMBE_9 [Gordonia phage Harambe]|uniref:Uncharacterized protein n=1 Tax=Gordonia phage Harambe TaxID=2510575 RepID=A0A411B2Q1_9CAUD|nr:hypothetical protein SEA_HARAMBE_9 [Gordonia phage Harambe]